MDHVGIEMERETDHRRGDSGDSEKGTRKMLGWRDVLNGLSNGIIAGSEKRHLY